MAARTRSCAPKLEQAELMSSAGTSSPSAAATRQASEGMQALGAQPPDTTMPMADAGSPARSSANRAARRAVSALS